MPSAASFVLNYAGIREFLRSVEVRAMVDAAAEEIAVKVHAAVPSDAVVEVQPYTTDREAAAVVIADVRAMSWQARDGVLTRAASESGAEVKKRTR